MDDIVIGIIGGIGTISAIIFAYLSFRRNDSNDLKDKALKEGELLSDIAYIKSSIDRMESKLDKVEDSYYTMLERIIKVEQNQRAVEKRLNDYFDSHSNR